MDPTFVLAAGPSGITTILIAVVGALGASIGGTLLVAGPQRRNITAEATERAISSIDKVRESLESRLAAVEHELQLTRERARALESDLELARAQHRAQAAELERQRDRLQQRIEQLEDQVRDFRRRLPDRRTDPPPKAPKPPDDS